MTETEARLSAIVEHIQGLPASQLAEWLKGALQGGEALPRFTPDEPADVSLARVTMELDGLARKTLPAATTDLVLAFVRAGHSDSSYVSALLGLARKLGLNDIIPALGAFGQSAEFDQAPLAQQAAVLGTLIDLRAPLNAAYWERFAQAGRHPTLVLTALLRNGPRGADILPLLHGGDDVGDAVYEVLSQHARQLEYQHRQLLADRVRVLLPRCGSTIGEAVKDWLAEQELPISAPNFAGLDAGLRQKLGAGYEPEPAPAKLLPLPRAA